MLVVASKEERVLEAYSILRREMSRYKKLVAFPKNTDPKKTYAWRYLVQFIDRVDSLELGEKDLDLIIPAVVCQAHKSGLLHRGIAILDQKDLLSSCQTKLEYEAKGERTAIESIKRSKSFVWRYAREKGLSVCDALAYRASRQAYANITSWYETNQISASYLAVSGCCKRAFGTLSLSELKLFPTAKNLLKIRLSLTGREDLLVQLRTILADDLYEDKHDKGRSLQKMSVSSEK